MVAHPYPQHWYISSHFNVYPFSTWHLLCLTMSNLPQSFHLGSLYFMESFNSRRIEKVTRHVSWIQRLVQFKKLLVHRNWKWVVTMVACGFRYFYGRKHWNRNITMWIFVKLVLYDILLLDPDWPHKRAMKIMIDEYLCGWS